MLQRNSSMLRRRFLQVGTTASAAAFGLRSVFAAQEEKRPRASSLDVRNPESIRSFLRNWFRLRSGVRNPLPGVYSSHGIETVYLIRCGDASVLVDTGFQHNFLGHLENFKTAGHDLDRVEAVLTSHFHVDHTAALRDANRVLGCPVVGHKNNLKVMGEGDLLATAAHMWAIPGWRFSYQPYDIDIVVEEGDTLSDRRLHLPSLPPAGSHSRLYRIPLERASDHGRRPLSPRCSGLERCALGIQLSGCDRHDEEDRLPETRPSASQSRGSLPLRAGSDGQRDGLRRAHAGE